MARELDVLGDQSDASAGCDELLRLVPPEVAEAPIVSAVRRPEDRSDVPECVRNREPSTPVNAQAGSASTE